MKGKIIKLIALIICTGVPFCAALSQFPIWAEKSAEATMSGTFFILAFAAVIPFVKQIIAFCKKTPAMLLPWWGALAILWAIQSIVQELIIVCFFGGIANTIGFFIYKLGEYVEKKERDG